MKSLASIRDHLAWQYPDLKFNRLKRLKDGTLRVEYTEDSARGAQLETLRHPGYVEMINHSIFEELKLNKRFKGVEVVCFGLH
jgi:hypothetical protein